MKLKPAKSGDQALKNSPAQAGGNLAQILAKVSQGRMELGEVLSLAESLKVGNDIEPANKVYRAWIDSTQSPFKYVALFNLGVGLAQVGDNAGAESIYRQAVALKPDFGEGHVNLGLTLEKLGKPMEAIAQWRLLTDVPATAASVSIAMITTALNHTGRLFEELREYDVAEVALERSLRVNPKQPDALQHWVHLRQKQCKWPAYIDIPGVTRCDMILATSPLAMLAESDDPGMQLLSAYSFNSRKFNGPESNISAGKKYNHKRLRIGYLSSDFCTHAVGLLLAEVFENHDRSKVETYGFCVSKEDGSDTRRRLVGAMEHFEKVGHLSDEQIAQRILACEIDILVDLNGLSSGTRVGVLSFRPAPVQATWLGFIGTTALPYVDYVIADQFSLPPELSNLFRERPLYLPHSFLPRDTKREVGTPATRAEHNLPENKFVFASFNNIYKLNSTMFECWMRILHRTPNSILWLLDDNKWATENLLACAQRHGVSADRIIFAGRVTPKDHLARLRLADVFLDNHPYNAGSTANDVLSVGLPLLTLSGRTFVSRMGGSLLSALGFDELITYTHAEYEEKAVGYALNPAVAVDVRKRLNIALNGHKVTKASDFAKNLEGILMKAAGHEPPAAAPVPVVQAIVQPQLASTPILVEPMLHPDVLAYNTASLFSPSRSQSVQPADGVAQKSLLVRGWRDINHSYSLVNQFQLIEMLKDEKLQIFHEDLPYVMPNWSAANNGSGFEDSIATKISGIPRYRGEPVDVAYSISSPFSLYRGRAKKVVTFMVTEFDLEPAAFTADSQNPAEFTSGNNWVVTPSRWSKSKLEAAGMNPDRIRVVPHGVDTKVFRPISDYERQQTRAQLGAAPDDFVLLNIGGAFWNKGGDLLLRAFAELRQQNPKLKLVIKDNRSLYARTTDDMVENLQKSYPGLFTVDVLQGIVILPTSMSMDQLRYLYGAADLYVSPYRAEGFNLPVLEAIACGLRTLVTKGGATDEFFHPSICTGIKSALVDPSQTGVPVKGLYLEPDFDDLRQRMAELVLAGSVGALPRRVTLSSEALSRWSWPGATQTLMKELFE
jgi:predicted O-linked N-acetylglucosamine transferase (SPINDLY family)